jgi:hypothetical protein
MKIKENSKYLVGTKLRKEGMVTITTSEIKDDKISIVIWSVKNGTLINFGEKNIIELQDIFEKDGYQEI